MLIVWSRVCVARAWILFRDSKIALASVDGVLYDGEGEFIADGVRMSDYAREEFGIEGDVPELQILAVADVTRIVNYLNYIAKTWEVVKVPSAELEVAFVEKVNLKEVYGSNAEEELLYREFMESIAVKHGWAVERYVNTLIVHGKDDYGNRCVVAVRGEDVIPVTTSLPEGIGKRNVWFANHMKRLAAETAKEMQEASSQYMEESGEGASPG